MPRNVDQSLIINEAGMKCLCIDCQYKTKCSFANTLWAAKSIAVKYGKFYPSFITFRCDRRENDLGKSIYSMTQIHLFFVKLGAEHLCDECEEKTVCEFYHFATAAHDIAGSQCFNPWHIVYKCIKKE